ncbi:hypothetical protein CISG_01667 [Coccidioides immitis RMSCC 3703]|uniref:Uncharacterized protein n=2 Tax=Coccidioides immitis TaxID=5501 RepID=A0A0J8TXE6_COCIT|nr:hypothetical protein CIRG_08305 [Coccidioides immitis RMSCC 2394]KMU78627.1 hypothetical protein CISG_01667 [Coccidioides immitis RMSCC 3703]
MSRRCITRIKEPRLLDLLPFRVYHITLRGSLLGYVRVCLAHKIHPGSVYSRVTPIKANQTVVHDAGGKVSHWTGVLRSLNPSSPRAPILLEQKGRKVYSGATFIHKLSTYLSVGVSAFKLAPPLHPPLGALHYIWRLGDLTCFDMFQQFRRGNFRRGVA